MPTGGLRADDVRRTILEAAIGSVAADRVIIYAVDQGLEPYGHWTASGGRFWGDLYARFAAGDPFHPRRFSVDPRNVVGTWLDLEADEGHRDYVVGFREKLGIAYKAEVFLRDRDGTIRGGLRLARRRGARDFRPRDIRALETLQPVFSTLWCAQLPMAPPASAALTAREREVMELVVIGMTNAEIVAELGISLPTVKHHVRAVLSKHNAANRRDLLSQLYVAAYRARPGSDPQGS